MKIKVTKYAFTLFLATPLVAILCSWGTWGHQHINRAAVFSLPEDMRVFFYNHIDFITEESTVPDLRKYTLNDKAEGPRHYIDLEAFEKPVDSMPLRPAEGYAMYKDSFLRRNGSLPWYIQDMMEKLTKAFKDNRRTEILFLAGDLGHYLGDAHMPLHTSSNHDGQLTNQKGIHSFWESQLPEQFGDAYNFHTGDAVYIEDVAKETWRIIKESHELADTLLAKERELRSTFPKDEMYKKDESGNLSKNKFNQQVRSAAYAKQYHDLLAGMVERQLRRAITATANFWYTAWFNAGKPDLSKLDDSELTAQNKEAYKKDYQQWKKGKLTKLKAEHEY